jgi:hypothetical protein
MSRSFAGGSDLMTYGSPSSAPAMNDALTLMAVVKITHTTDGSWASIIEMQNGAGNICCLLRGADSPSGRLVFVNPVGALYPATGGAIPITDADGWMVLAITRSTAAATNFYKIPIGGSTETDVGGAMADNASWQSSGTPTLTLGGPEDAVPIIFAAAAYWDGVTLSQAQIEGVATAKTTQSILDLSPTWCVDDSDAFATNLADPGEGDRTAISGTTDSGDDPAGWVYLGGSSGTTITVESLYSAG